jgi:uncharacterized delta-60 repeat protein
MRSIKLLGTVALAGLAAMALTGTASARVALDPGFSGDGWLTTWVAQSSSGARQVVRTPGGYIYTYGVANFNTGTVRVDDTVVNRYLHDGTPDPNWDGNGIAYGGSDVLGFGPQAGGMVVNSDLSVTTAASNAGDGKVILERFDRNGGRVWAKPVTLTGGARPFVQGLVRDSAGRLLVGGYVDEPSGRRELFVIRFDANGNPDSRFGNHALGAGTTTFAIYRNNVLTEATALSIAIDNSDRVLLGGYYVDPNSPTVFAFVERFSTGGAPETFRPLTWSSGTATAGYAGVTAIAVNADGRVAVAAQTLFGTTGSAAVARLTPDLALDNEFDGDGRKLLSFGGVGSTLATVAWGPHSWIYAGGTTWNSATSGDGKFALARLRYNGDYDATFDDDGKIVTPIPGATRAGIQSLVVSPTNDLPIVAGSAYVAGATQIAVARYADVP